MQVEAIPMLINGDFLNAPLDVKMHLADYKMYGEDSYVFQQKELLHGLYECTYLSMNDRRINREAFEYLTANNKHIGKALSNVYDIKQKEELSALTAMQTVAASSTAMQAVADSSTAMQAVAASSTAMQAVADSSTAMQAVAASSTAMQAVLASSTAMQAVLASSTAMQEVAASSTAMQAVLASSTAMQEVAASSTAMQEVAASSTAMIAIFNRADTRIWIRKSAIALAEICKSREASIFVKNSFNYSSDINEIMETLSNSPQYFSKLETEWYHYGDKANSVIKVAGDNTIVIPKSMWCYYNRGGYGKLFNGSDQSLVIERKDMSQDYPYTINNMISFRGMYFQGGPYVRTYATVFTIKDD